MTKTRLVRIQEHTLLPALLGTAPLVIDLGANHGECSQAMLDQFGARCIAVEPNPQLVDIIRRRKCTDRLLQAAIAAHNGQTELGVVANDKESSILSTGGKVHATYRVRAMTLESLIDDYQLGAAALMKVDIEGLEPVALMGVRSDQLAGIKQISVEFHDHQGIIAPADERSVSQRLLDEGFDRFQMSRSNLDVLFVRQGLLSALEVRRVRLVGELLHPAARALKRNFCFSRPKAKPT